MFLLTDVPNVRNHLQNKLQTCAEKIKVLEVSLCYFTVFFIYVINVAISETILCFSRQWVTAVPLCYD